MGFEGEDWRSGILSQGHAISVAKRRSIALELFRLAGAQTVSQSRKHSGKAKRKITKCLYSSTARSAAQHEIGEIIPDDLINAWLLLVLRRDRSPKVAKPMWKEQKTESGPAEAVQFF